MKLYSNVSIIFSIWVFGILTISFFGFSSVPHSEVFPNDFFRSLANWDGGHFLGIAKYGYKEKFQFAFFPLYPLAVRLLNHLIQNYLVSGILISVMSSFLGMHILYRLVLLDFDKKIAEKVILFMLFFPTSFFLLTAYSEGLFFLLTVLTFYLLRKKRLFLATLTAALVSATRLVGLAVVLGFLVEIILTQGFNRKNWYVLFAPLGFVIYCLFLYKQTGDPFYFVSAETHWQRTVSVPVLGFWEALKSLVQSGFIANHLNSFLDLLFAIFGLGLVIRTFRFLIPSYAVYSLFSIVLPLFTPSLSSIPRFLIVIFPIFILIALTKKQYLISAYQMLSLMLLSAFTMLYINGFWVS